MTVTVGITIGISVGITIGITKITSVGITKITGVGITKITRVGRVRPRPPRMGWHLIAPGERSGPAVAAA